MERFARRWWGGELGVAGNALGLVAAPASWLWAGAAAMRARRHRHGERVPGLGVISVGNLAVGGTGKTPVTAWVAGTLRGADVTACVLVGPEGADEALLHRAWHPDVPVYVGRDRAAGAVRARAEGARIAILDDGFQHTALGRDLDLVLLSADDPNPRHVLPRGPYRECRRALSRADVAVITRRAAGLGRARELAADVAQRFGGLVQGCVHLAPGAWRGLDGAPADPPLGDVLAVCGVARPESFRRAVAECVEGAVDLVAFADHHAYTPADVRRLCRKARGRPLVLTEKDAAKFAAAAGVVVGTGGGLPPVLVLADRMSWDWGEESVRARLLAVAGAGHPA